MTQKLQSKRTFIFAIICLLIVLLTGSVTLLWQIQQQRQGHAKSQGTGGSIVGAPTLAAATVDKIFTQMGSPMVGTGSVVEQASRQTNIDDAFALGVWWTETNDGAAGVGLADRNPGSVRGSVGYPSAYDGYTIYPSYAAAITDWFNVLKSRYVSRGLSSVYTLCYSYVGTASAPLWAAKVVNLMYRYQGIAPPPQVPPTAKAQQTKATPALSPLSPRAIHARQLARVAKLSDNTMPPGNIGAILSSQTRQPVVQGDSQFASVRSPSLPALPLVCFGLLAALAIVLAGLRIGRETTSGVPTLGTTMVGVAATFENPMRRSVLTAPNTDALLSGSQFTISNTQPTQQYSRITEALSPSFAQSEEMVPQLDFPPFPAVYQPGTRQYFSPLAGQYTPIPGSVGESAISERPTLPMPVVANNSGLLRQYRTKIASTNR